MHIPCPKGNKTKTMPMKNWLLLYFCCKECYETPNKWSESIVDLESKLGMTESHL
jgi:hypothetical protein